MIYNFILQIVFFVGLGVVVYMIARGIPDAPEEQPRGRFGRWVSSLPFDRIDSAISAFIEKILRKTKVAILKLDNLITGYLNRIRANNSDKD